MIETTLADREAEVKSLLTQIEAHPERDWSEARARIAVLNRVIAGAR